MGGGRIRGRGGGSLEMRLKRYILIMMQSSLDKRYVYAEYSRAYMDTHRTFGMRLYPFQDINSPTRHLSHR